MQISKVSQMTHFVSPSALLANEQGALGKQHVGKLNTVDTHTLMTQCWLKINKVSI